MKPSKTLYWIITIIFATLMLLDGFAGFAMTEEGKAAMQQLGYPNYIMYLVGTGKILGAIAILQTRYKTIKEWAYAGYTINFISAAVSWAIVGAPIAFSIFPLIMLALMFFTYYIWKKYERRSSQVPAFAI
jgi:hypothetical protein